MHFRLRKYRASIQSLTTLVYRCLYMTHATRAIQNHDLSGEGIISGSHTYFSTIQGHGGPPRMRDELMPRASSEATQTWKTIHIKHTLSHPNKGNIIMEWRVRRPNDIRGPWGPKVSWHLSYRWGKIPKNLTQETCPDRGSNPGPLRDKRAYYHLFHSGGHKTIKIHSLLVYTQRF